MDATGEDLRQIIEKDREYDGDFDSLDRDAENFKPRVTRNFQLDRGMPINAVWDIKIFTRKPSSSRIYVLFTLFQLFKKFR